MAMAASPAPDEQKRQKQGRSPAYPGIDLEKAIEKARALLDAEGKYAVPLSSAFAAWGFGAKSSGGRETKAALRYFGLITIEPGKKAKLTDKALRVLLDEREDQTEKRALIRELALTPAIHKKLYEQYPDGIKSTATVEHFLIFDEKYNKQAAGEIVTEFQATAIYARLYEPAIMPDKSGEAGGDPGEEKPGATPGFTPPPPPPPPAGGAGQKVKLMEGERVVFTEETNPQTYVKLVASGEVDASLLEALQDFVKRQKKRLGIADDLGKSASH
jgi:hypothetical protein